MRIIAIFADGTGNGSASLFRTNVWRLYKALDLTCEDQIAYYHDGVGSSSFKPLAILGGVFGYGLKRNVVDIYRFICRAYRPGDRIMLFGFSRGAFTVRLLAGLMCKQGIIVGASDHELEVYCRDAYREYRRGMGVDPKVDGLAALTRRAIPSLFRLLRDGWLAVRRRIGRDRPFSKLGVTTKPSIHPLGQNDIALVGVWDTVAAYGLPIDELTYGIDKWLWPMSFAEFTLDPKVERGVHALALDDERNTFHPLIWDEMDETPERITQVWFAGMHADVGGGYPDDGLSYIPLRWMVEQAQRLPADPTLPATRDGLVFSPREVQEIRERADHLGRLNNSRKGLGGYYRLLPRKLQIFLEKPGSWSLFRSRSLNRPQLDRIKIHESVLQRIADGGRNYAPAGLPGDYDLVDDKNTILPPREQEMPASNRTARQEWVWDTIWWRRANYFATVIVSLVLASMPFWSSAAETDVCAGITCVVQPVMDAAALALPAFAGVWLNAFAANSLSFLILVGLLVFLLYRNGWRERHARDQMRGIWGDSLGKQFPGPAKAFVKATGPSNGLFKLRTHRWYQASFGALKWYVVPTVFAAFVAACLVVLPAALAMTTLARAAFWLRDAAICPDGGEPSGYAAIPFATAELCGKPMLAQVQNGQPVPLQQGKIYEIEIDVTEPWLDHTVATSPLGFSTTEFAGPKRIAILARRSTSGLWFQPGLIIQGGEGASTQLLEVAHKEGTPQDAYYARFVAPRDGVARLFVNDALGFWPFDALAKSNEICPDARSIGWLLSDCFYRNNHGKAKVTIRRLDAPKPADGPAGPVDIPRASP